MHMYINLLLAVDLLRTEDQAIRKGICVSAYASRSYSVLCDHKHCPDSLCFDVPAGFQQLPLPE